MSAPWQISGLRRDTNSCSRAFPAPGRRAAGLLCLVGEGPERPHLETQADRLGIASDVVWAGRREHARALVRAFDVAALCSRSEGLPLAALEAMAAGVPLVGPVSGGCRNSSPAAAASWSTPIPSRSQRRCRACSRTPSGRRQSVVPAGSVVAARYGFGEMVEQMQALYDRATGRPPPDEPIRRSRGDAGLQRSRDHRVRHRLRPRADSRGLRADRRRRRLRGRDRGWRQRPSPATRGSAC